MTSLQKRFRSPPTDLAASLRLRRGSMRDYKALSEHHYRAASPATASRVLVLEHDAPSVVGRYLGRRGSRQPAAVLVESMPTLDCRMRDHAMGGRYGSWLPAAQRAALLNAEVRCISRVVVAPTWRGLGLAVRLVGVALDEPTTPVTEALAAMGRVCPFFEKAGMTAYPPPPRPHDQRLLAALASLGLEESALERIDPLETRIGALPEASRRFLEHELRRWTRAATRRGADQGRREQLRLAQQKLRFNPVYYVARHAPDTPPQLAPLAAVGLTTRTHRADPRPQAPGPRP